MDDTPIFASVERDLRVSYGAITEPLSQDVGTSVLAEVTPDTVPARTLPDPRPERFDRRRWRHR
jgi:hypothetical protein